MKLHEIFRLFLKFCGQWLCFCPKWHGWSLSWTSVFEPRSSTRQNSEIFWQRMYNTIHNTLIFYIKKKSLEVVVRSQFYHSAKQMYRIETTNTHCKEMLACFNQRFNEADWWSEGRTLRTTLLYTPLRQIHRLVFHPTHCYAGSYAGTLCQRALSAISTKRSNTSWVDFSHIGNIGNIGYAHSPDGKHIIIIQYVLAHLNNSVSCVVLVCNLRNLHLCFATIINQS